MTSRMRGDEVSVAAIHFGKSDDIDENIERLLSLNDQAAQKGAKLIVNAELPTVPLFGPAAPIPCPDCNRPPPWGSPESKAAIATAAQLADGPCATLVQRLREEVVQPYQAVVVTAVFRTDSESIFTSALVLSVDGTTHFDKQVLTAEGHYVTKGSPLSKSAHGSQAIGAAVCADYCRLENDAPLPMLAGAGYRWIAVPASIDGRTTETLGGHGLNAAVIMANSFEHHYQHGEPPETCIVSAGGEVLARCDDLRDQIVMAVA